MRNIDQKRNEEFEVCVLQRRPRNVIVNSYQDLTKRARMLSQVQHERKGNRSGSLLICLVVLICLIACQQVQKPELNGTGPLAVVVPRGSTAPEYHAPLERWRVTHMDAINQGDFSQKECVLCHNPKTGCNQCHAYIGAKEVIVPEASLYWPTSKE